MCTCVYMCVHVLHMQGKYGRIKTSKTRIALNSKRQTQKYFVVLVILVRVVDTLKFDVNPFSDVLITGQTIHVK